MKTILPDLKDLRKEFPRSPAEVLGGFVVLARVIDKCRATVARINGEYRYNCPLDQRFFSFTEIDADELKKVIASGKSDADIVKWVKKKTTKLSADEVWAWNYDQIHRSPQAVDEKAYFESYRCQFAPNKPYISTWFQMLDAEEKRI
jgi:hypothetical protein